MISITKKPLAYLVLHINKLDTTEFSERDRSLLLAGEGDGGEVMGGGGWRISIVSESNYANPP